jgi:hypothetical protein
MQVFLYFLEVPFPCTFQTRTDQQEMIYVLISCFTECTNGGDIFVVSWFMFCSIYDCVTSLLFISPDFILIGSFPVLCHILCGFDIDLSCICRYCNDFFSSWSALHRSCQYIFWWNFTIRSHSSFDIGCSISFSTGSSLFFCITSCILFRDGPFILKGGLYYFSKKNSDSQCCWKKYSDFGGGKKIFWFRVFVI